jgi:hypothetical protein
MNDTSWSRSYYVVLCLATALLPGGAYVAARTTQVSAYVLTEMHAIDVAELPPSTQFFARHGYGGTAAITGASLLGIICMGMKRHLALGTVVSAIVFAVAMAFFLGLALASYSPFLGIMWRLS